ncbi:MAG: hypothetical protein HQL55_12990 [Magnetococcales bacterium]|nr:hypothetical protein [Magnetococcales bacterium]
MNPPVSNMPHHIIDPGGDHIAGRIVVFRQCLEVGFATGDLGIFFFPQIVREKPCAGSPLRILSEGQSAPVLPAERQDVMAA